MEYVKDGRPFIVRGDYVIGFDLQDLYSISIRYPSLSTDHQMILAELTGIIER